jgi:hypothetical protein
MSEAKAASAVRPNKTTSSGQVMRKCDRCKKKEKKSFLQRRAVREGPEMQVPPIVHEVLRSPGQPLDAATREFMEPRFGHDFSRVRVHTDGMAAESARAVNALAYTVGRDVVFGANQYATGTSEGRQIMAHELTHVLQQKASLLDLSGSIGVSSDDRLENEAKAMANSHQSGLAFISHKTRAPSIQREDAGSGGRATAPTSYRFSSEGVAVVVRESCAPDVFGFANVEDATRTALDMIFNTECIEESRRLRIQRNLTAHGLDIRCRRSANIGGACADATTGFYTPANFFTLGSSSFAGHPDSSPGCQPLASTILHEIVHLTRGFAQEALPLSCEASCFGVGGGNPELCRDIDLFGRRRAP